MINIVRQHNVISKSAAFFSIATTIHFPIVYDPGKAGWKTSADGKTIEMKDGNPIWIDADGTEKVLKQDAIAELSREAAQHRREKSEAQTELAKFKGIDPEKAKEAFATLSKIDQKKLIDAGEVDKVRAEISREYETKIAEGDKARTELQAKYDGLQIDNVFSGSPFVRDGIAIPQDMFQAYFRNNFKIGADGKIEAYGKDGNRVFSKKNHGQYADPDEALEIMVNSHPQKDVILKPTGHSGTGNNGNGSHRPGVRTMKRAEYDQLSVSNPGEAAKLAGEMRAGTFNVID